MSKSYQMLIASENAKKGIDNCPKMEDINKALVKGFTEEEL